MSILQLPPTVDLDKETQSLAILDQTRLPNEVTVLKLTQLKDIREAIYALRVRGAPAIGVAAAIGIYVAARQFAGLDYKSFTEQFHQAKIYLAAARPTAVNLSWALNRMEQVILQHPTLPADDLLPLLHDEALAIRQEDIETCRKIGEYGLSLLKSGMGILTHCNAGRLAAVEYGTATAPIYVGQERGIYFRIYADETRPLLQGARLTACELHMAGIDVTLLCDNMVSYAMQQGLIDAVFVGCDRVAANGDTANKIGTSGVAVLAKHYGIPFYVCAPFSTIDLSCPNGADIPVEQRDGAEVTDLWYCQPMSPTGIKVLNPAFDVTGHSLITAFITERGILQPPF